MCVNGETVQITAPPSTGAGHKSDYMNALSCAPGIHLLLRPGHYDLLYSRNDNEVITFRECLYSY